MTFYTICKYEFRLRSEMNLFKSGPVQELK